MGPRHAPDLGALDHREFLRHVERDHIVLPRASSGFSGYSEKVDLLFKAVLLNAVLDPCRETVLVHEPIVKAPGVNQLFPFVIDRGQGG